MVDWKRFVSSVGAGRIIASLGVLEVVMAAVRIFIWTGGSELPDVVATDMLIILPGVVLLYAGYWLPDTDLHPDVYPRIVARCVAGIGVMLGVVGLLAVSTGLNRPVFTPMAGIALGSVAGFIIGLNEARALSRAHEAEEARLEAEHHRDELRQERDLRERIVQTSPVGIAIIDTDGSIRMVNEHAARIIGLPKQELEAVDYYNDPKFEATDANGEPFERGMFEEILETGEAAYDVERQITSADGQRIWLSLNGAPLRDPSGDMKAVVVAFEDITERKESQQRLKESNQRLEQFAYAASHDLQEPLRMVSTYLQLIERRYADEFDEEGQEFFEFAIDGADRMRQMVEGLLKYSRVDTDGDPFEPVDLNAVVNGVHEDLHVKIEESNAEITVETLPTVKGDEEQLRQVFQNLLDNAIEYSGDDPPRVHVAAEQAGSEWRISVSDEGIGIDPDDADRIFEVFQSLHSQHDHDGTGIGLALCERVIERHGGNIWVDSDVGEGSTFYFTLHDADEEQEPQAPGESPAVTE